mgnify:CR=1 FL=1
MPRTLDPQGYMSAQDPRTMPGYSGTTPPIQPPPLPTDTYNANPTGEFDFQSMIQNLKQAQAFGYQQQSNAQNQQFQRGTSPLPGDLANKQLSPSQIRSFRSGEVSAIEPTVGGARNLVAEAKSAIENYQTAQNTARDDARNVIKDALTIGGGASFDKLVIYKKVGTREWNTCTHGSERKRFIQ